MVAIRYLYHTRFLSSSQVSGPHRGLQGVVQLLDKLTKWFFKFPAPLEVDRYLYLISKLAKDLNTCKFPAPREVDR